MTRLSSTEQLPSRHSSVNSINLLTANFMYDQLIRLIDLVSLYRRAIRAAFKNRQRGAVLTTHYMEEAEAVCDRVAIMVSGQLRWVSTSIDV